jgi:hypothetical protein
MVTTWVAGVTLALICNLFNNLPAGLLAGSVVSASHVPRQVASAVLIGVDLGPNLSVTGSLATILWLSALRREKSAGERLDLSETRYIGDAAGFAARDCGPAGHRLRSLSLQRLRPEPSMSGLLLRRVSMPVESA